MNTLTAVAPRYRRIDYDKYVVVPIWYYCNSKCTFCMVEKQIGELPRVNFPQFQKILEAIIREGKHDNLILSGAEVTTFDQLENYVRYAASLGWFKRIQIQTNARRLASRDLTDRLVAAGLNEFFVSIHGTEATQDLVTEAPGGYRETMAGLENICSHEGMNLITNTVLTTRNFANLPELYRMLLTMPVSEMHMWNFFPMSGEDKHDLLVNMKDFYAFLPELLAIIEPSERPLVLKGFPECLSLGAPGIFDNKFPLNLIDVAFWENFDENQFGKCVYKHECKAKTCFGLSHAYVKKFGEERDLLCPFK
jgi:MoaA/NifB/PqqE/SkfB family radical SAM enzyme